MAPQVDVVGVGANSVDYVSLLPHCPEPQGQWAKMRIRRQVICSGGQTATAMVTCASLGLTARYVGVVGNDENGRRIREELHQRDVVADRVVVREAPNAFAVILVDESTGERIVLWDRDERLLMREEEMPTELLAASRVVHVDDVDEGAAIWAARAGRAAGAAVTSDIDRLTERVGELIEAVTYPIFAEHIPLQLTGDNDVERALYRLRSRFPQLLTVTLGARGAMALHGDRVIHAPGFRIDAVDTTGAGDLFRGGFIYALLQGWPVEEILRFANATAAVGCTRLGAMAGAPSLADVEALMAGPGKR